MSQPFITLHTPSGATVELRAHKSCEHVHYSSMILINNQIVAHACAGRTHELDENDLILDAANIRLLPESAARAIQFFKETAEYIQGGPL